MDIGNKQKIIISKAKEYIFRASKNLNSQLSSYCYLGIIDRTPGWSKIKLIEKGWLFFPKYLLVMLKHIFAIGLLNDYLLYGSKSLNSKKKILIISWSFKQNFSSDGSFNDRYLNENSRNYKDTQWILISMDDFLPRKLDENIIIVKKKNNKFKFNILFFLKNLINILIKNKFSIRKMLHFFSSHSIQALKFSNVIFENINFDHFSKILVPYESQPFQNYFFSRLKKIKKDITTIGYVHSMLPSLPTNYIFREGSPDILLVHGKNQKVILKKFLGWPAKKIKIIDSLRYRKNSNKILSNKIFLPYGILDFNQYIKKFEKFLKNSKNFSLPFFDILNHPTQTYSKKHLLFKKKISILIEEYKDKFDKDSKKKLSICFGWTAAVLEILEKKIDVIHICSDPITESFNKEIWSGLEVKKIDNFILKYKLLSHNKYINFGKGKNLLKNCLKNIK